jgi:superfamily I DNA and RNA helicase
VGEACLKKSEQNHVLHDQQQQKSNFLVPVGKKRDFGRQGTQKTVFKSIKYTYFIAIRVSGNERLRSFDFNSLFSDRVIR